MAGPIVHFKVGMIGQRLVGPLLAALLLCGCAGRHTSQRPWLNPPEQWGAGDANIIWYESPWVAVKKLTTSTLEGPLPMAYESHADPQDPSSRIMIWDAHPDLDTSEYWRVASSEYRVRWISARTMCLADQVRGLSSPPRSEMCPVVSDSYRIMVDHPLTNLKADEKVLRLHSYILPRRLGVRIRPTSVEHVWGGKIVLVFPRKTRDGRVVVSLDESSVEAVLSDGRRRWKVKFKPKEMIGPAGPDL